VVGRVIGARSCIVLLVAICACMSCAREPPVNAEASASERYRPVASIQDLMKGQIEPAAVFIWEAVSTTTTLEGTEERRPQSIEEWQALRNEALTLIESANLLLIPNRKVIVAGGTLEDAHVEGIFAPQEIEHAIDVDRRAYEAHVQQLRDSTMRVLIAIDARSADALIEAGGHLDEACESCHLKYWYPNTKVPPELAAAQPSR
jgi:hypothetical protein